MTNLIELRLPELRKWVEDATGRDDDIDRAIWYKLIFDPELAKGGLDYLKIIGSATPLYTASIDAALALVERKLPNARVVLQREPESYARAEIIEGRNKSTRLLGDVERGDGEAPLAILSALLAALEQTP